MWHTCSNLWEEAVIYPITYLYLKHDGQTEIVDKEPPRIGQQRLLSTYLFLKQDRHAEIIDIEQPRIGQPCLSSTLHFG
jgi:hypothetical protein